MNVLMGPTGVTERHVQPTVKSVPPESTNVPESSGLGMGGRAATVWVTFSPHCHLSSRLQKLPPPVTRKLRTVSTSCPLVPALGESGTAGMSVEAEGGTQGEGLGPARGGDGGPWIGVEQV